MAPVVFCTPEQARLLAQTGSGNVIVAPQINVDAPKLIKKIAKRSPAFSKLLVKSRAKSLYSIVKRYKLQFLFPMCGVPDLSEQLRVAAWIPDLQHRKLTNFFSEWEIRERDELCRECASYNSRILFSSENAKADFESFYPDSRAIHKVMRFRVNVPKSTTDVDPFSILKRYNLPSNFMLCCAQFWSHKKS